MFIKVSGNCGLISLSGNYNGHIEDLALSLEKHDDFPMSVVNMSISARLVAVEHFFVVSLNIQLDLELFDTSIDRD